MVSPPKLENIISQLEGQSIVGYQSFVAEKITPKATDFPQWYQDVVLQARLADYSTVKGCMVIRPNGYHIWERIQQTLDSKFKDLGVRNAYFPMFIPESFIKKEAEHVEGFSPQLAVVTHAGGKDLEEALVVRPTSETIINSMFAKWIQSYRDLPLVLNQWANVVRWEMRTRLFLRTTEFLWQEGHTCHATLNEAEAMARQMATLYQNFVAEVLAMPVYMGQKSESEKFAGALRTYTIEGMMGDKKALQSGTSHNLSDNFAKAFSTKFLDKDGVQKNVFQSSWGVSTRLIGGLVMTHSDDRGLVLPPAVAPLHVVIIPIGTKDPHVYANLITEAKRIEETTRKAAHKLPYPVTIKIDADENQQAGWKFHEYEITGVPIQVELGPRDIQNRCGVVKRRDQAKKESVGLDRISDRIVELLSSMQTDLYKTAKDFRDSHTFPVDKVSEFETKLESEGGFFRLGWCQSKKCETKIATSTKATIRCIELNEDFTPIKASACLFCGEKSAVQALVAKAY